MKLDKIEIVNFGKYSGFSFAPEETLTEFPGANESGKTTLVEFIRRMFYGFPDRRSKLNSYPAADPSGAYGGRLSGRLADGRAFTLERLGTAKGGKLTVVCDGQEIAAPETFLKNLLGVSEAFYRGVYAVTLAELQAPELLATPEIGQQLYGAETELGGSRLAALKKELMSEADAIYRPSGSTQLLARLKKEMQSLEEAFSRASGDPTAFAAAEEELAQCRKFLPQLEALNELHARARRAAETAAGLTAKADSLTVPVCSAAENALLTRGEKLTEMEKFIELYKADVKRAEESARRIAAGEEAAQAAFRAAQARTAHRRMVVRVIFGAAALGCTAAGILLSPWSFAALLPLLGFFVFALRLFAAPTVQSAGFPQEKEALATLEHKNAAFLARLEEVLAPHSDSPLAALRRELDALARARETSRRAAAAAAKKRDADAAAHEAKAASAALEKEFASAFAALAPSAGVKSPDDLADALRSALGRAGELRSRMEMLRRADKSEELRGQIEEIRAQAASAARDYLVKRTALDLLDAAVRRYEKEHQSEVVSLASGLFRAFTLERYGGLRQSLETHELFAVRSDGRELRVPELSSGTREQLLLAMRLGLIEYSERHGEPLPVVLDDVLVDFDSERKSAAMTVLKAFSLRHQTLLFQHT